MPANFKTLTEANEGFDALTTQHETAAAALTAAQAQAQANFSALQAMTAERDTATAALAESKATADAAIAALKLDKDGEPARVSAAVTSAIASQGIPDPTKAVDTPQTPTKPDFSALTGIDKAIAAHKLSIPTK